MSWKSRLLAPLAGALLGALAAIGLWFAFFEYDPSLTAHGFFQKIWQELVAQAEVATVVACIGGALGLLAGIFVAIFGLD
jgi:hypothetical protein